MPVPAGRNTWLLAQAGFIAIYFVGVLMAFSGLRRDGNESESCDQDQFAHVKSPLLDERRLQKRFDPRCETDHAGSGVRKERQ